MADDLFEILLSFRLVVDNTDSVVDPGVIGNEASLGEDDEASAGSKCHYNASVSKN